MRFKYKEKEIDGERWIKFDNKYEEWRYRNGNKLIFFLILTLFIIFLFLMIYVMPEITLLKTNPCQLCEDRGYSCIIFNYAQ